MDVIKLFKLVYLFPIIEPDLSKANIQWNVQEESEHLTLAVEGILEGRI